MVTIGKPNSITVTVRDRINNRSQSITVYNTTLDDIVKKIQRSLKE